MSLRKDEAQLIITIDAKESLAFQKTLETANKGLGDLKKLTVGSEEFNKTLTEQKRISDQLAKSDYSKLSQKQLTDRRTQLANLQKILPAVTFAEQGFERELRQVNTALGENARRVRAVGQEMNNQLKSTNIFKAALLGAFAGFTIQSALSRLKAFGLEIFNQIKRIDGLNKAFKIIIPDVNRQAAATEFLRRISQSYGLQLTELRSQYLKYTAVAQSTNLTLQDQELIFESVAKAGSVLGLSVETQERALTALQQIMSKGTVQAEELKGQLGDALPGAVNIMAKALGVSNAELAKMLKNGEVLAQDALPKFAIELQKTYNIDTVDRIDNITSAQNRFKNVFTELVTVVGNASSGVITGFFNGLSAIGKGLKEFIAPTRSALTQTALLKEEFNSTIGVLKRLNPESEVRNQLIKEINEKYGEYLPNLLTEKSSIDDITKAQEAANQTFQEKIILLAFEEERTKSIEKQKKAIQDLAGAELRRAKAGQRRETGPSAFRNPLTEGFLGGASLTQKDEDVLFNAQKDAANKELQLAQAEIKDIEASYNKIATEIGTSLDKIRAKFTKTVETKNKSVSSGGKSTASDKTAKEDQFSTILDIGPILNQGAIRDAAIKEIQDRELAAYETFYLEGKVSEEEYQIERNRITAAWLETRIDQLDTYGAKETEERKALYNELLTLDRQNAEDRAKQYQEIAEGQLTQEEQGFALQLANEETRELRILQARVNSDRALLQQLQDTGLQQTEIYRKVQEQMLADQFEFDKKRAESTERTEKLKKNVMQDGFTAASDLFSLGADLLLEDEKARKKNASAIKAFQVAAVTTNGINEVAAIWKNAAEFYGPAAPIIGGIQSALAIGRTVLGVSRIQKQKFSTGHLFRGRSHSQGGIDIRMPDGNIGEVEGGETLINKRSSSVFAPVLDYINRYNGYGKPLFESGTRFTAANTTPSLPGVNIGAAAASAYDGRMEAVLNGMVAWANSLSGIELNARVGLDSLESAQSTKSTIINLASYR